MKNHSILHKHYRSCNLCEAICGLVIEYQGSEIRAIKGDPDDPLSKGHICPKAVALQDIYNDPKRLRQPMRKTPSGWQEISWQEAYRETGKKITEIQAKYGPDAIAFYQGNPTVHSYGAMLFNRLLKKALGTRNNYSATSLDQLPHQYVAQLMFGHPLMIPVPDIDRTDFFLVIGGNPLVSNGSMMTAPGIGQRLKAIRQRGGKVVVVDPRRTETAKKADQHLFIAPETDVYLLLALINEVVSQGKVKAGGVGNYITNLATVEEMVKPYSAAKVSPVTGVAAADIKALAKAFAAAPTAVCYGRMGVSVQKHGTLNQWLINVLNIITGNFDRPGGHMFTHPAVDVRRGKNRLTKPRWYSRVSKKPEIMGEFPTAVLAEEMLEPGKGQIKGFIVSAGNPVSSAPRGRKLAKALEGLQFMVALDIYVNETTQHADIILPPATGLEVDHYDLAFASLAVRNYTKYSPALFKPGPGTQYDWQIFKNLAKQIKNPASLKEKLLNWWLTPAKTLNIGLKTGPYKLSLKKLKSHPHGLDLGPLKPMLPDSLFTPDKRINLAPDNLVAAITSLKLPADNASSESYPLKLISRRNLRSNNSWMHGLERLAGGSNTCTLQINPQDAQGLANGEMVTVKSVTGAIEVPLEITDDMMPGVVSLPFGWPTTEDGTGNYNDLVAEAHTDTLTGNAGFSGVEVAISKY